MDFFDNDDNGDGVVIEDNNANTNFYVNAPTNANPNVQQGNFGYFEADADGANNNYQQWKNPEGMGGVTTSGFDNNLGFSGEVDLEERQRQEERHVEENAKRERLLQKQNEELNQKDEIRNKAREWIENTNRLYEKNISNKREFNKNNESDFLNNRNLAKEGKTNPWDIVIGNIDLRESDYKGSKDVSRMKNVIITRKNDFNNLKIR